jgi:hypothetical protein
MWVPAPGIDTETRKNRIFPNMLHHVECISTKGPQNRRSLHGTSHGKPGQVGCASFGSPDLGAFCFLASLHAKERCRSFSFPREGEHCHSLDNSDSRSAALVVTRESVGFPSGIGRTDPRSQKRDLGHPSVITETVGYFALDLAQASRLLGACDFLFPLCFAAGKS